ncbi:hypothetical protein JNUCC1_03355 [Lentibacillus sp. JNUCC-1]|uniref:hypothetical protein n=1 Tax=Lentibacillus sp. JNUCC-1 TaxID=2654513 RepID=UPI0012E84B2E|nr:hypothetical protein [Lentibacillus sp. JNUCC-1]MUV39477.1 hypothetical protein [Lentibacillus sp. JNUCC-1]
MINMKSIILSALENNASLVSVIDSYNGYPAIFPNKSPTNQDFDNYVTYQLINNVNVDYGDNKAIREYIHFQVSGFVRNASTTTIGQEISNSMESIGFYRTYIGEIYESDTGYTHVSTRWKTKIRKGNK